ncbi:MAG: Hsp20/alpha crystallin family protein, partial [Gammaproteobacteria bacterium]
MVADGLAPEAIVSTIVAVGDRMIPFGTPLLVVFVTPLVDIYETGNAVIVTTDLPEVKKDDINVSMTGGTLTINAEIKRETRKGGHWVKHERRVGTYVRSLQLSGEVDPEKIEANFNDGILELTISKP